MNRNHPSTGPHILRDAAGVLASLRSLPALAILFAFILTTLGCTRTHYRRQADREVTTPDGT